jgi:hypothetical protein
MASPAAVAAVGTRLRVELGPHEMAAAGATMARAAEDSDLVYKIGFFHLGMTAFGASGKDTG